MFDRSTIERALTRVGLALNRTLVAYPSPSVIKQFKSVIKPWPKQKLSRAESLTSSQRPSLLPKRNAMPSERSGIRHTARLMVFAENAMN